MAEERRLDYFSLNTDEGSILLSLEKEQEEALEKFLADEYIRMKCLLCSELSTHSRDRMSYNLPLHCNELHSHRGYIHALLRFKQPECDKNLPDLTEDSLIKIINEKVECPVCKKTRIEPSISRGIKRSYDPQGHMASGGGVWSSLDYFACHHCGVTLTKKVLIRKAYSLVKDYLYEKGLLEDDED